MFSVKIHPMTSRGASEHVPALHYIRFELSKGRHAQSIATRGSISVPSQGTRVTLITLRCALSREVCAEPVSVTMGLLRNTNYAMLTNACLSTVKVTKHNLVLLKHIWTQWGLTQSNLNASVAN